MDCVEPVEPVPALSAQGTLPFTVNVTHTIDDAVMEEVKTVVASQGAQQRELFAVAGIVMQNVEAAREREVSANLRRRRPPQLQKTSASVSQASK